MLSIGAVPTILALLSLSRHRQCYFSTVTVEAKVSGRADEEGLEEVGLSQLVDVARDVDVTAGDGNGATEAEKPVEVEGGDLGVVTLEVGEVKVVRKGLLEIGSVSGLRGKGCLPDSQQISVVVFYYFVIAGSEPRKS